MSGVMSIRWLTPPGFGPGSHHHLRIQNTATTCRWAADCATPIPEHLKKKEITTPYTESPRATAVRQAPRHSMGRLSKNSSLMS